MIEAAARLRESNVFLIVFGSMTEDIRESCTPLFKDNVKYIGWIDSKDVYPYFLASDLAVFPGTQSVLWEQSVACGVPGIFKDWNGGFSHVDCGGNARFINEITVDSLVQEIESIVKDSARYIAMSQVAQNKARTAFSYIEIAKKSIGL